MAPQAGDQPELPAIERLTAHIEGLRDNVEEFRFEIRELRRATMQLVTLQERQVATNERVSKIESELASHETRLSKIESRQPSLIETRQWLVVGAASAIAALVTYFFSHMAEHGVVPLTQQRTVTIQTEGRKP